MWALLAAARRRLDRGHYSADWMVEIEALGSRMNWLYLERQAAHGAKFPGGRPKGILWRAIEEVVRDSENHLRWTDVMHAMLPSSRKPGSPRAKRGDRMSGRSSSGQT
jgi:hypothetical protein